MLNPEEQLDLKVRKNRGESIRSLSRATGRSRNTVRKYLRNETPILRRKHASKRAGKLDPYKTYLIERLRAAAPKRIPAATLLGEIKARGYDGGLTRVKEFIRNLREAAEPSAAQRELETDVSAGELFLTAA